MVHGSSQSPLAFLLLNEIFHERPTSFKISMLLCQNKLTGMKSSHKKYGLPCEVVKCIEFKMFILLVKIDEISWKIYASLETYSCSWPICPICLIRYNCFTLNNYTASQKHESTLLHMYRVNNEFVNDTVW